jgi:hypothetical protein
MHASCGRRRLRRHADKGMPQPFLRRLCHTRPLELVVELHALAFELLCALAQLLHSSAQLAKINVHDLYRRHRLL